MISHLFIKNIALITELSIDLENGFNVLSGETGAGKSIIVDSVNLILGKRADKDLIRAGQETARVEALIETGNKELLKECLEAYGIEGDELIISRELSQSGKNVCRINGQLSSLTQLRDIVSRFIDICGQNDNIMLLDEKYHMTLVDEFGGEEISLLKEKAAEAYEEYHRLSRELKELQKGVEDKERLTDLYRYQIDEISGANVKPGEDDELTEERDMMLNAEKLAKHLYEAKENISGNKGTLETLYEALENIREISGINDRLKKLEQVVNDAYYEIEDASYELSDISDRVTFDERRLDWIEDRLQELNRLKRKYGGSLEKVLETMEGLQSQLDTLDNSEYELQQLIKKTEASRQDMEKVFSELTSKRREYSRRFEKRLIGELSDLGMKNAELVTQYEKIPYSKDGWDYISFMISVNRGTPPRKLSKIASGGELSRIMLAIKNIVAENENIETVIFDEIDTGISGVMARVVAEKIANISRKRQVICVTHLPQIASMGDTNYVITKNEKEEFVSTSLTRLDREGLLSEIARLSGGIQSSKAREHAIELVENAEAVKRNLA